MWKQPAQTAWARPQPPGRPGAGCPPGREAIRVGIGTGGGAGGGATHRTASSARLRFGAQQAPAQAPRSRTKSQLGAPRRQCRARDLVNTCPPRLGELPPLACSLPEHRPIIRCLHPRTGAARAACSRAPAPTLHCSLLRRRARPTSSARPVQMHGRLGWLACAWVQHNERLASGSRAA